MPNCKSFLVFPARQGAEGNSRHSDRNIRGTCTISCHRHKTRWPSLNVVIHELILEDRHISAKSIGEQLGISRERVGSIIREDLPMRKVFTKWVPKCLNTDHKRQRCQSSEQLLEFFRRDPNDFLSGAIGDHGRNLVISL